MKTRSLNTLPKVLGFALVILLSAFANPGGDSYTIHLGNQLLTQQYVHMQKNAPDLTLDESSQDLAIKVYYSHCGQIGKDRQLTIQNKNKILQKWSYPNALSEHNAMKIEVKDLFHLKDLGPDNLDLVYSSKELPEGRILARFQLSQKVRAASGE